MTNYLINFLDNLIKNQVISLENNIDLNDIKETGIYSQVQQYHEILNYPNAFSRTYNFTLQVIKMPKYPCIQQILISNDVIFVRTYSEHNQTWSKWNKCLQEIIN